MKIATRDYARQQRPRNGPPPRKPVSRKGPAKKPAAAGSAALGLPLWAWMVVALSLVVFASALYYVSRPVAPMDMAPTSTAKDGKGGKAIEIPPKEPSRFAFYEMLPSYEVVVPDDVINPPKPKPGSNRNNLPAAAPAAPPPAGVPSDIAALPADLRLEIATAVKPPAATEAKPAAVAAKPAKAETIAEIARPAPPPPRSAEAELAAAVAREAPPQPTAQLAQGERFVIQVAAFRTKPDAEQRVAALTMSGLNARVEQVTIDNKDTWYRVRLGPYNSAAAAASAQQSLRSQGFSGVVMKVKS